MPDSPGTIQFGADRGDSRLRLDQVIVRRVTDVSRLTRTTAQRWITAGVVSVNGHVANRPSTRVREGAVIAIDLPASAVLRERPRPEVLPLSVLFEDDSLLVVDKAAGTIVHPSYKRRAGTLLNAVLWRLRNRPHVRPGILTRLDRDTSGLVVIALSPDVHTALQRASANGHIRKQYLAIVRGTPPLSGRITLPLARDPDDRRRVIAREGGMPSETRFERLATGALPDIGAVSLIQCELVTGRTHQIRVHLSASGWSVAGDTVYGDRRDAAVLPRQALHAWRVTLRHPVSGTPLHIEAAVPEDIAATLRAAGLLTPNS